MSVWADIHRRSNGFSARMEDSHLIYNGECDVVNLYEDKYNGMDYQIITNGQYPILKILNKQPISFFSGDKMVTLTDKSGNNYTLSRTKRRNQAGGAEAFFSLFTYYFNTKKDYICDLNDVDRDIQLEDSQPGHKYTLGELKKYAEMFIDLISEKESDVGKYIE